MNIALITIVGVTNYGAVLQAYALQQVMKRYGDVKLINYSNAHFEPERSLIRVRPGIRGAMGIAKDLVRLLPRRRLLKKFAAFVTSHLALTAPSSRQGLMSSHGGEFDVYVSGSDQIWNPSCVSSAGVLDDVYFSAFAPAEARKVSYASSWGGYRFTDSEKRDLVGHLARFQAISVRESDARQYLEAAGLRGVQHVLDPTLLLTSAQWRGIAVSPEQATPYLLVYSVPKASLLQAAIKHFAKKLGLRVVALDPGLYAGLAVDQHIRDAGVEEFVGLFDNAQFVVTDSFHGVCFSVLLNKPFAAVNPGVHANRVESLLARLGLEHRYVSGLEDMDSVSADCDFTAANVLLEDARRESLEFLQGALGAPQLQSGENV